MREPLKVQLENTWNNLTETNTSEKKGLSLQLNAAQEEFYTLKKRHALGHIGLDVYTEFKAEMEQRSKPLLISSKNWSKTYRTPKSSSITPANWPATS